MNLTRGSGLFHHSPNLVYSAQSTDRRPQRAGANSAGLVISVTAYYPIFVDYYHDSALYNKLRLNRDYDIYSFMRTVGPGNTLRTLRFVRSSANRARQRPESHMNPVTL